MGLRGFIRDVICLYIGFQILSYGLRGIPFSKGQALFFGLFLLLFSVWFILERVGVLPKL